MRIVSGEPWLTKTDGWAAGGIAVRRNARARGTLALMIAVAVLVVRPASAADGALHLAPAGEAAPGPGGAVQWSSVALFAGGAASAFLMHEGCHLAANLAFGNTPSIESVSFAGVLPFFAVSPDITCPGGRCVDRHGHPFSGGRQGVFTIVMAGIHCQHLEDEILLGTEPRLRERDAPFRKGMLAFNTLSSIAYVAANWASLEPPAGDLRGTYRDTGAPRHVMNALVLGAAAIDLTRYFFPDVAWLPWLSRAAKAGVVGITFTL